MIAFLLLSLSNFIFYVTLSRRVASWPVEEVNRKRGLRTVCCLKIYWRSHSTCIPLLKLGCQTQIRDATDIPYLPRVGHENILLVRTLIGEYLEKNMNIVSITMQYNTFENLKFVISSSPIKTLWEAIIVHNEFSELSAETVDWYVKTNYCIGLRADYLYHVSRFIPCQLPVHLPFVPKKASNRW